MSYRLTFLGTGSSGGVPRIGNVWGAADKNNPKNRRRRCSVLIERLGSQGRTVVLIDTSPDLRDQCLTFDVAHVDAVLYTHDHADHTHGIDELRVFALTERRRIPCYMDDATWDSLLPRFRYCFEKKLGSNYLPILERRPIAPGTPVIIDGKGGPIALMPILQDHGELPSLGFRVGNLCYSPDIVGIPPQSEQAFENLDTWIVDALRPMPHPSHWSVKQALAALDCYKPKRGILTHMHIDLDYNTLVGQLPPHITPAYDGMVIEFN